MTTRHIDVEHRHPLTSRKDNLVQYPNYQLSLVREYHARLRAEREADRLVRVPERSIRALVGESIIRFGRRVAGDGLASPVLTG